MAACRIVDLRGKEVINICDGNRMGIPSDVELDQTTGQITALVVSGPGRFFGLFGRGPEYVIPWEVIRRIGDDIILVEYPDCPPPYPSRRRY